MAYDVTITGFNKNEDVIFSTDANWISGFHLTSDKRFGQFEVNPGYLDMSARLSILYCKISSVYCANNKTSAL